MSRKLRLDMRVPSSWSISPIAGINGLMFISLNIADAWLTKQVLAMGWQEINPIVRTYGTNMMVKGFLALAIALALVRFGKTKLLWTLNAFMSAVVLWHCAGLLHLIP